MTVGERHKLPIPWTPLARPLDRCRFGLVTSGGLYHKGHEPPFDAEWEKREPTWGNPSFGVLQNINILPPIHRFQELVAERRIGSLAGEAYSFMGYQGFPADLSGWREVYGPQVAERLIADEVDCVLLTTA